MFQIIRQNNEERINMYMKCSKKELASMLSARDVYDSPSSCTECKNEETQATDKFCSTKSLTGTNKGEDVIETKWRTLCNFYLKTFCKKHGYEYDEYAWIDDDPGTIFIMNDMYINMEDIRYDIDNAIPSDEFEKWYWKSVDVYELTGCKWLTYKAFCKGEPDYYPDEELEEIHKLQQKVQDAKLELENAIKNIRK